MALELRGRAGRAAAVVVAVLVLTAPTSAQEPPALTSPVNDFANLVDPESARTLDTLIRSLQQASGDVVIVATVETVAPYADIQEYAVKMFANGGRGIGQGGKDNGVLVLVAAKERQVRIEVGYDLEQFVTDGFAGETVRQYIAPDFRRNNYGEGLVSGVSRVVARIAQGRNVVLQGLPERSDRRSGNSGNNLAVWVFIAFIVLNALGRMRRRRGGRFGRGSWSGWSSGVGPFGGGFGGGFGGFGGGGGGGGGFGGFGGGRSGGGGGGGGW